jgi:hypothetical protein
MKRLLLLPLIFLLAACSALPFNRPGPENVTPPAGTPAAPQGDLEKNQGLWKNAGVQSYRFKLHIGCFCAFRDRMPLSIEVRDGQVTSMTYSDGTPVPAGDPALEMFDRFSTIERTFAELRSGPSASAEQVRITFDPTYGFPADLYIDPLQQAADDEFTVQVSEFEVLK